jgi:hypothetical protein
MEILASRESQLSQISGADLAGVLFLFVERCRKLKPKPADADENNPS